MTKQWLIGIGLFCGVTTGKDVAQAAELKPLPANGWSNFEWSAKPETKLPLVAFNQSTANNTTTIATPGFQFYNEADAKAPQDPCVPPGWPVLICWFDYNTSGLIDVDVKGGKASRMPADIILHLDFRDAPASDKDGKIELRYGQTKLLLSYEKRNNNKLTCHLSSDTFLQISKAIALEIYPESNQQGFLLDGMYMQPLRDLANTFSPGAKPSPKARPAASPPNRPGKR